MSATRKKITKKKVTRQHTTFSSGNVELDLKVTVPIKKKVPTLKLKARTTCSREETALHVFCENTTPDKYSSMNRDLSLLFNPESKKVMARIGCQNIINLIKNKEEAEGVVEWLCKQYDITLK